MDHLEEGRTRIEGSEEVQGLEKGGWSSAATAKAVACTALAVRKGVRSEPLEPLKRWRNRFSGTSFSEGS